MPEGVTADEARRWAESQGKRIPQPAYSDKPDWVWFEGEPGDYTGYLPETWESNPTTGRTSATTSRCSSRTSSPTATRT